MIVFGKKNAIVREAARVSVHGQESWRVVFSLAETPDQVMEAHLAPSSTYSDPKAGDMVTVTFAAGMAMEIRKQ